MSTALDFLGISPAGLNGIPALAPGKNEAAEEAGRLAMDLLSAYRDVRPSHVITREALENAIASIAATGGSTNGVLHLLAIASELDLELSLDDFDRIAARTPVVASLKPGGRFVATDVYEAGGVALIAQELLKRELVHAGAPNVDGRSLGEIAAAVEESPGQEVVVPLETPLKPTGGLAVMFYDSLAPEGYVVKLAGHERLLHRVARVFDFGGSVLRCGESAEHRARRRGRDSLRGPRGQARHAGDAARDRRARRRGAGRLGRAHHRRALFGRDAWAHGRARLAEAAHGGPLAALRGGDTVVVDVEARGLWAEALGRRAGGTARRLGAAGAPLHARGLR